MEQEKEAWPEVGGCTCECASAARGRGQSSAGPRRWPVVVLLRARTRTLLAGLLDVAAPQRWSSITWRLHRAEELAAGNFPAIWRHAAQADGCRRKA
jgi:hypothetical protein